MGGKGLEDVILDIFHGKVSEVNPVREEVNAEVKLAEVGIVTISTVRPKFQVSVGKTFDRFAAK